MWVKNLTETITLLDKVGLVPHTGISRFYTNFHKNDHKPNHGKGLKNLRKAAKIFSRLATPQSGRFVEL